MLEEILFISIKEILALSDKTMSNLNRLNIYSLRDLIFYLPSTYLAKLLTPNLEPALDGKIIQTEIVICEIKNIGSRVKILVQDNQTIIELIFFNKIHPYISSKLTIGSKHVISGKIQYYEGNYQIIHPEFIFNKDLNSNFEPIYPLTYGVTNKQLYGYILQALSILETIKVSESEAQLYQHIKYILNELKILHLYHFDNSEVCIETLWEDARLKLAQKELLINQFLLNKLQSNRNIKNNQQVLKAVKVQKKILDRLGFNLTKGQNKVIKEIENDQSKKTQMIRLLQGDVGSGKTLVALLTIINVAVVGSQSALLAPTDLLAKQHFNFFQKALNEENIIVELLTGKTSAKEKKRIKQELAQGVICILIGTHALLQEDVNFHDLAYVVIDEQHKFGVEQRRMLTEKASYPDILLMTATPIPRSLTLTIFGDMDVSKLISKPLNRLPIITLKCACNKIEEVIFSLNQKIQAREKIFWICPLIDQNDDEEQGKSNIVSNVENRFAILNKYYKGRVGIIHGKMLPAEKDLVMTNLQEDKLDIIVATTVIEVGIDIANATLIVIENAELFGLAQLHQLRGRVGRGILQSHCILMYNPHRLSNLARERLDIMKKSNDGFYIAEKDMLLRGSGEILGIKQSGLPKFYFADLTKDLKILEEANQQVNELKNNNEIDFLIKLFAKNCFDSTKVSC